MASDEKIFLSAWAAHISMNSIGFMAGRNGLDDSDVQNGATKWSIWGSAGLAGPGLPVTPRPDFQRRSHHHTSVCKGGGFCMDMVKRPYCYRLHTVAL